MANDKRFIVKNGLRSQNVEFTDSQDGSNQITLNMLNTDTLNFEGDAGSLFSIADDLTGSSLLVIYLVFLLLKPTATLIT